MNNQIAKKFDTLSLLKFTLPSMIVMLFMPNDFVGILISGGFLLLGYTLYQM